MNGFIVSSQGPQLLGFPRRDFSYEETEGKI